MKKAFREKHVWPHIQNLPSQWSIGSTCSGTGNFELAMHAVAEAMNEALEDEDGFPFEVILPQDNLIRFDLCLGLHGRSQDPIRLRLAYTDYTILVWTELKSK